MQATQPAIPPLKPVKNSRRASRRRTKPRNHPYQAIALETTAKLVTNLIFSAVATSALIQLLPSHRAVQEKLREIQAEVQVTQGRVDRAKASLGRYFDPSLAKSVMQEHTNRTDPQQRQIIWVEKGENDPEGSTPRP